jgi:hypothetical protein
MSNGVRGSIFVLDPLLKSGCSGLLGSLEIFMLARFEFVVYAHEVRDIGERYMWVQAGE